MDHHQSVDGLMNLFLKSNRDLSMVRNKLQKEFQQIYTKNHNPMILVSRLEKIEDEMSLLKDQCQQLLIAKQNLIDKARAVLVGNMTLVQKLQASTGVPVASDADDLAYKNFNQVIDEWTVQVKARAAHFKPCER